MSQLNGLRGDLEIVQLLCGEEIAGTAAAAQSANFVYMVMDSETRRAAVFDACWDIASIFGAAEALEVEITAALYTHHHYDHAGGRMGRRGVLQGAKEMVNRGVRVLVHEDDTTAVRKQCDVPQAEPMAQNDSPPSQTSAAATLPSAAIAQSSFEFSQVSPPPGPSTTWGISQAHARLGVAGAVAAPLALGPRAAASEYSQQLTCFAGLRSRRVERWLYAPARL
jgi:hypothetical protein